MARNILKEISTAFKGEVTLTDITDLTSSGLSIKKFFLLIREILVSIKKDNVFMVATALAYKSLVALVPILAICLSIVAMLEQRPSHVEAGQAVEAVSYSENFLQVLLDKIPEFGGKEDLINSVRKFADNARAIAGVSFVLLFFTAYSLLGSIEQAFNDLWQVKEKRPFLSKFSAFLCTLLTVPVLMSLSVYFSTRLGLDSTSTAGQVASVVGSVIVTQIAMAAMFYLLPNTPVRLKAALAGGFICGLCIEVAKFGFQIFAMYVGANYARIYGPLLAFPFFLMWLLMVWVLVMLGAEITFVMQNFSDLAARSELERRGVNSRIYLAIRVVLESARFHRKGIQKSRLADHVASMLKMPPYLIRSVVAELNQRGILRNIAGSDEAYLPAKDISALTVGEVVRVVDDSPFEVPPASGNKTDRIRDKVADLFDGCIESIDNVIGRVSLAELVDFAVVNCDNDEAESESNEPGIETEGDVAGSGDNSKDDENIEESTADNFDNDFEEGQESSFEAVGGDTEILSADEEKTMPCPSNEEISDAEIVLPDSNDGADGDEHKKPDNDGFYN
jgi:membrane protein